MSGRTVQFWGPPDAERLICRDFDEAVDEILDYMHLDYMHPTPISELPDTIDVVGYAPIEISINELYDPLNEIIDRLYEQYGDPAGEYVPAKTEKMQAARDQFLNVVRAEYQKQCWACEEITRVAVNVREWIEQHRPDWIKEGEVSE